MSVDQNVAAMRRWFQEVWNEGRIQTVYDLMADHVVAVGQEMAGKEIHSPAEFVDLVHRFRGAFKNMHFTVDDAFGSGDRVALRWSATMTHAGDFLDLSATNRQVRITGTTIAQFENGKIIRGWDNWDQAALMQQISSSAASA
jgi:steroid delta-isomerase-like uncharacterized protein